MKRSHALHIGLFVGIAIILTLVSMFFIHGTWYGLWNNVKSVLPLFIPSAAALLTGLILQLVKKPKWKIIYTTAWILLAIMISISIGLLIVWIIHPNYSG